jgi:ribosomal protein S13
MARISSVDLPRNKRERHRLAYIYGIVRSGGRKFLKPPEWM